MQNKKILIVDDDVDVIGMLQPVLEKEGFTVVSANNKKEGIEKAKTESPDLFILDVMMTSHYEGFELCKEIREIPEFLETPVLMETGIEVLDATGPSQEKMREMAHEFRQDPLNRELQVVLIRNTGTGEAAIDYRSGTGESVWLTVNGFIRKPAKPVEVVSTVKKLLG